MLIENRRLCRTPHNYPGMESIDRLIDWLIDWLLLDIKRQIVHYDSNFPSCIVSHSFFISVVFLFLSWLCHWKGIENRMGIEFECISLTAIGTNYMFMQHLSWPPLHWWMAKIDINYIVMYLPSDCWHDDHYM